MKFLLDENVSNRVASHLKAAGHDAVHVSEIGLTSTEDALILDRARQEDRVLRSAELAELLLAALAAGLEAPLAIGAIATLTPDRERFRPLPLRSDAGS